MAAVRQVVVVSYNLLAQPLCDPEDYVLSARTHLEDEFRFRSVCKKLKQHTENLAIIALQELTQDWAEKLIEWFSVRQYRLQVHHYGRPDQGNMGVGIAYPCLIYENVDREPIAFRLTEKKPEGWGFLDVISELEPIEEQEAHTLHAPQPTWEDLSVKTEYRQPAMRVRPPSPHPHDIWSKARWKNNAIMIMNLRRVGNYTDPGILVATYHMPCAFLQPKIMTIHTMLAMHVVQKLASERKIPFVFLGDFNMKPRDPTYVLCTHMAFPMDVQWQPQVPKSDTTWPRNSNDLEEFFPLGAVRSAYAEQNGCEPEFTNYAYKKHNGVAPDEAFRDTIDYIFISKEWSVKKVGELPSVEDVEEKGIRSFPCSDRPSDHLLIWAELSL